MANLWKESNCYTMDLIEIGMVKIQFWLGSVEQKNLGIREAAAWAVLLAVTMAEIYLLFWLG